MKKSLISRSLGWKYFKSLRDEIDEAIYRFKDGFMRRFVKQNQKGGRTIAFYQNYESKLAENFFETLSEVLDVKGNVCGVIEAYVEDMNKKTIEKKLILILMISVKLLKKTNKYVKNQLSEFPLFEKNQNFYGECFDGF